MLFCNSIHFLPPVDLSYAVNNVNESFFLSKVFFFLHVLFLCFSSLFLHIRFFPRILLFFPYVSVHIKERGLKKLFESLVQLSEVVDWVFTV